jgi:hypothetical protein
VWAYKYNFASKIMTIFVHITAVYNGVYGSMGHIEKVIVQEKAMANHSCTAKLA